MNQPLHNRPLRTIRTADRPFLRQLLLLILIAAITISLWRISDLFLLAFAAVLLALLLRSLARILSSLTGMPTTWAVAPVVLILLASLSTVGWLFGSQVTTQFHELAKDLPQGATRLAQQIRASPWGPGLLDTATSMDLASATQTIAHRLALFFGSTVRATAYSAVMLFAAVYLAAQPDRYRIGLLRLVGARYRPRIEQVAELIGATLRRWLFAQSVTMAVVGILTGIGLWILGIPAPLALGLIAGIFAFVPYAGPILAALPGLLMAATQGLTPTLYVAALYASVHFVEGNLLTPLVQDKAVELPPVLTLFATLAFSILAGPVGVLLAGPLTVVILVLVNCLYIEDGLEEPRLWPPRQPGEHVD